MALPVLESATRFSGRMMPALRSKQQSKVRQKRKRIGILLASALVVPLLTAGFVTLVPSQDPKSETYRVEFNRAIHTSVVCKIYGDVSPECDERHQSDPSYHAWMRCMFLGNSRQDCTEKVMGPLEKRKDW
jgi:hypothetical protein